MKLFLLLLSLECMLCGSSKSAQEYSTTFEYPCDTTITLGLNTSFSLQMPIIQGTGYEWQMVSQSNPSILIQKNEEMFTTKNREDKDGMKAMQIIKLNTLDKVGVDTLVFHYLRKFEKNKSPEKVCTVVIIVK